MAIQVVTTVNNITDNTFLLGTTALESPFYPSRNVAPAGSTSLIGITEYQFSGATGLRFGNGATTVFGKPKLKAGRSDVLTSANAPFFWSEVIEVNGNNQTGTTITIDSTSTIFNNQLAGLTFTIIDGSEFTVVSNTPTQMTISPAATAGQLDDDMDIFPARYYQNPQTPVDVESDGSVIQIEERVAIRITGAQPSPSSTSAGLIQGDNTCRPIFYGVDFFFDGYTESINPVGDGSDGTLVEAGPQFYDCNFYFPNVVATTNTFARMNGFNYVVRGLNVVDSDDRGGFEIAAPPVVPSNNLTVNLPNFNMFGDRAFLWFVSGGTADRDRRYGYRGLSAPSGCVFGGGGGGTFDADRGVTLVNPSGSPIPWTTGTTTNTSDNIPILSVQSIDALFNRSPVGGGSTWQTVTINFDAPGYQLRVRRNEVNNWQFRNDRLQMVTFNGVTKNSNGSLAATTTNNVIPSLGTGTRPTTQSATTNNFSYVDYPGDEVVVFDGFDQEVSGTSIDIAVPVWHHIPRTASGQTPTIMQFFRWNVFAIHRDRGITDVIDLNFLPNEYANAGSVTAPIIGSGNNLEIDLSSALDNISDSEVSGTVINPTSTRSTTDVELYNQIKTYQLQRDSNNNYDSSRVNSEFTVVRDNAGVADLGVLDLNQNTTNLQRLVQGVSLTTASGAYTDGAIAVRNGVMSPTTDILDWTTTGNIDARVFSSNISDRNLTCAALTNVGSSSGSGVVTAQQITFLAGQNNITIEGVDLSAIPTQGSSSWASSAGQTIVLDEVATGFFTAAEIVAINSVPAMLGVLRGTGFGQTFTHENQTGTWAVRNVTNDAWEVAPTRFTRGTTLNSFTADTLGNNDEYIIYWKRDSDDNNGFLGTVGIPVNGATYTVTLPQETLVSPRGVDILYTPSSSITLSGGVTTAFPTVTNTGTGANTLLNIAYRSRANSGITYSRNANVDKYLLAQATNTVNYIEVMGRRELTTDYVAFGAQDSRVNDNICRFNTDFTGEQQELVGLRNINGNDFDSTAITQITGTDSSSNAISFPSVVIIPNPVGLTVGEAQVAAEAALEQNNIATDQDVANAGITGVVSRNGNILTPDLTQ